MSSAVSWIFDSVPASGARLGGLAQAQVFDNDVDSFVREVLQNARDQRLPDSGPARVRFHLQELDGPDLENLLTAVRWDSLRTHLASVAESGHVTISPRIRASLDGLDSADSLRVMVIDDLGTRGLTGGEDEPESNFNALCRHTLITSGGRRDSGGSFGLGKSVLWRFSGFSTVLFYSLLVPDLRSRFFGRTLLSYHNTQDGEWEGSGWLGVPEERKNGRRAISVWDTEASELAELAGTTRQGESGTSILILGFDDPTREEEPSVLQLCEEILASTSRWFWPAIVGGQMIVDVQGTVRGNEVFKRQADITEEVRPFIHAQQATVDDSKGRLSDPGAVACREVPIKVPAQRSDQFDSPLAGCSATATLKVRLAETGESLRANQVALQRGTGMVVQYQIPPRKSLTDQAFHATLVAGLAHGTGDTDRAAEQFLRAAEPVAHTEWTSTTDRIHAEYAAGSQASLRQFNDAVAASLADILSEPPAATAQGPDALRRLFPLPGAGGGSISREPYRLHSPRGGLVAGEWQFGGTYVRAAPAQDPWMFRVFLEVAQEDGGSGERLTVTALRAGQGASAVPSADGSWLVTVPEGVRSVEFDGKAVSPVGVPPSGVARTRVRLDVRATSEVSP